MSTKIQEPLNTPLLLQIEEGLSSLDSKISCFFQEYTQLICTHSKTSPQNSICVHSPQSITSLFEPCHTAIKEAASLCKKGTQLLHQLKGKPGKSLISSAVELLIGSIRTRMVAWKQLEQSIKEPSSPSLKLPSYSVESFESLTRSLQKPIESACNLLNSSGELHLHFSNEIPEDSTTADLLFQKNVKLWQDFKKQKQNLSTQLKDQNITPLLQALKKAEQLLDSDLERSTLFFQNKLSKQVFDFFAKCSLFIETPILEPSVRTPISSSLYTPIETSIQKAADLTKEKKSLIQALSVVEDKLDTRPILTCLELFTNTITSSLLKKLQEKEIPTHYQSQVSSTLPLASNHQHTDITLQKTMIQIGSLLKEAALIQADITLILENPLKDHEAFHTVMERSVLFHFEKETLLQKIASSPKVKKFLHLLIATLNHADHELFELTEICSQKHKALTKL